MLTYLAGFSVLALLMVGGRWLIRTRRRRGTAHGLRSGGVLVLRPPRGGFVMLAGLALLPTLLVGAVAVRVARDGTSGPAGLAAAGAVVLAGLVGSGWLLASEWRNRLRVDDAAIERVGVATRRRIAWAEVTRIAYNPTSRWFFVTSAGGRLWVAESLEGIGDLARIALARLPPAVLQASPHAREALEDIAAEAGAAP